METISEMITFWWDDSDDNMLYIKEVDAYFREELFKASHWFKRRVVASWMKTVLWYFEYFSYCLNSYLSEKISYIIFNMFRDLFNKIKMKPVVYNMTLINSLLFGVFIMRLFFQTFESG